jgi:hypothetical protein
MVTPKQGRGDEIDALVGALRAEDGGDEELERVLMMQGAARIRVGGPQSP